MDAAEAVDRLVSDWQTVHPELDFGPMALFARSNRFVGVALRRLDVALGEFGLTVGEFDVLSALRRSGEPFTLKPSELADRLMVTRAGITARIDRLEEHGVVARTRDPQDRRSEPIVLTDVGRGLIERALVAYLSAEADLFAGLTPEEHANLDAMLRRLISRATA